MSLLLDIGELGQFTPLRWQKAVHPSPIHAIWHARQNKRTPLAAAAEQIACIHDNHASLSRESGPLADIILLMRTVDAGRRASNGTNSNLSRSARFREYPASSVCLARQAEIMSFAHSPTRLDERMMTRLRSFVKALFAAKTSIGDQAYSYAAGFIDLATHWQAWRSASASLGQRDADRITTSPNIRAGIWLPRARHNVAYRTPRPDDLPQAGGYPSWRAPEVVARATQHSP